MKERLAERFALKHQEVRMIDSEAKNLQYMVCDGGDGLTREQAETLLHELPLLLEVYL